MTTAAGLVRRGACALATAGAIAGLASVLGLSVGGSASIGGVVKSPELATRHTASAASAPAIVFVSRRVTQDRTQVSGLGPFGRTRAVGGKLMVRSASGAVRELLPRGTFFDVADPTVSWDGRIIAFAAVAAPDSAWRIWKVEASGRGLTAVTRSDRTLDLTSMGAAASRFARYDDFDPAWLPDGRIVFASTRYPQLAEHERLVASNLFAIEADGRGLRRVTSEHNGAEEPTIDPRDGQVVYARWWTNRYFASDKTPSGLATERALAVPGEDVNLWHAITVTPDGEFPRLAGGYPRVRALTMAYQPLVLDDGTLVAVTAERNALLPTPGRVRIHAFPGGFSEPLAIPAASGGARDSASGAIAACAPASLGGRRLAIACDPQRRGDFGIYVTSLDGGPLAKLVDLRNTDELDPAMLAPRRRPPIIQPTASLLPNDAPPTDVATFLARGETFRFDCLNVFANAPVDAPFPDAPPLQDGVRIRFYASLSRPAAQGGDTVVLVRESGLQPGGAVHEDDLPADTPMFEQLIDAHGRVLRSTAGPAHVPGTNAARFGSGTKCVGCHLGHSAIPIARSAFEGKRSNAAPSARVTASSSAAGTAGPRAAVDRRTRGPVEQVAWIAEGAGEERLRLDWSTPIDVDTLILYALVSHSPGGTTHEVRECRLGLFLNGRAVGERVVKSPLSPSGTAVGFGGVRADAAEFVALRTTGSVLGRPRVALAEIAAIARLAEH